MKLAALLLVALWLPSTLHCQLESLGLDTLFACATESDQPAHSNGTGCPEAACQTIESGQVAFSKSRLDLGQLAAFACVCAHCFLQVASPAPAPDIFPTRQDETLPLRRTWQFDRRAALPALAPDLVA